MLELKGIIKDYPLGEDVVHALRGVSLDFRRNEFVSILGPSGCGKTTMLNIIGGLDQYSGGDLIINGKSTKDFNDRDWDTYRNHSIGFVFQSYNLIPHQTVLQNVEIALALSGVSKPERRRRAKAALEEVGLGNQLNKKPGEMSGGQMQRVAIARALVNDPDIILADEPTGALDSETGIMVMDILRKVSSDRLVIMVTHNPELAEKYSTRIVKMIDGNVVDDSMPLDEEEKERERKYSQQLEENGKQAEAEGKKGKKSAEKRKPSMSLLTSFSLSLRNLFTKKGRTALTSFAGSIGIIGIALIYAVSQGMTTYIDLVQEETLSSYPLMIESEHADMGAMLMSFMESALSQSEHDNDAVYEKPALYELVNAINSQEIAQNDLASFKKYIDKELQNPESDLYNSLTGVKYSYNFNMKVYTRNVDGTVIRSDTQSLMSELLSKYMKGMSSSSTLLSGGSMAAMAASSMGLWQEMLCGKNGEYVNPLIERQYEMACDGGRWPSAWNEIVIVLDENNEIDDMTLYALGLKSEEEMKAIIDAAFNGSKLEMQSKKWSYEEILGMQFKVILNADCYQLNNASGYYEDVSKTQTGLDYLYDNEGFDLKVVGIVRAKEDSLTGMLTGTIAYTNALTERMMMETRNSDAYKAQEANPMIDVLTGKPFKEGNDKLSVKEKAEKFREYMNGLEEAGLSEAYIKIRSIAPEEYLEGVKGIAELLYPTREDKENMIIDGFVQMTGLSEETMRGYIEAMSDEEINELFMQSILEVAQEEYANLVREMLSLTMTQAQRAELLKNALSSYTDEQCAQYYDVALEFSTSDYNKNLNTLGYIDIDRPSTINLYASSFEDKDAIEAIISAYNNSVDEKSQIAYTDYVGLMMSSVTTIINVITYVLIAFVAISLVVSSIMIGVITLISVQERTKEIGILRAIGASKRNISTMFSAETVIIGFTSGALGVIVTYLLTIPINLILHVLTGMGNLNAILPIPFALILVAISVVLTLIAGIIPSGSASRKDPVVALRTE